MRNLLRIVCTQADFESGPSNETITVYRVQMGEDLHLLNTQLGGTE
jgi:hypothetical protein